MSDEQADWAAECEGRATELRARLNVLEAGLRSMLEHHKLVAEEGAIRVRGSMGHTRDVHQARTARDALFAKKLGDLLSMTAPSVSDTAIDVDVDKHLEHLETGEGEMWARTSEARHCKFCGVENGELVGVPCAPGKSHMFGPTPYPRPRPNEAPPAGWEVGDRIMAARDEYRAGHEEGAQAVRRIVGAVARPPSISGDHRLRATHFLLGLGDGEPDDEDVTALADEFVMVEALARESAPRPETATARPFHEWHEDHGPVLWWNFPVTEPPYAGTPLDDDWPVYKTHWTPMPPAPAAPTGGTEP